MSGLEKLEDDMSGKTALNKEKELNPRLFFRLKSRHIPSILGHGGRCGVTIKHAILFPETIKKFLLTIPIIKQSLEAYPKWLKNVSWS